MKHLRRIFLLLGAVILVVLVRRIGLDTIWTQLQTMGWWSLAIIGVSASWYLCYTLAWRFTLPADAPITLRQLYRIKIIGETVNTLTPVNFVGGDPVRAYSLSSYFPWVHGAASVVIDRFLYTCSTLILIIVGATVGFLHLPHLPSYFAYGIPTFVGVMALALVFFFRHQRRGLFSYGLNLLTTLRIRRSFSQKTVTHCAELDTQITRFYQDHSRQFWQALSMQLIGRSCGIIEIYAVGHLINPQFGWTESIILCALAPVVNALFSFIPGALGIMEGAYTGLLYFLSFEPTLGLSIQIIKRIRTVFWISIGFLFMSTQKHRKHSTQSDLCSRPQAGERSEVHMTPPEESSPQEESARVRITGQHGPWLRWFNFPFAIVHILVSLLQLIVLACLPKSTFHRWYQHLELKEQNKRITIIQKYITPGTTVLDVGAGSGRFGSALAEALDVQVTGVDVIDYADHSIPVHIYDGKRLPFADKSFDTLIIAFVLHHIEDQEQIIREMERCARKNIIIFEDTYDSPWQRLYIMWNDYHTNILQEIIKVWKGYSRADVTSMPMPYTFRSVRGWHTFFQQFSVQSTTAELRYSGYKPLTKVTMCLELH